MNMRFLVLSIALLCFVAGAAIADVYVDVDVSYTQLSITPTSSGATATMTGTEDSAIHVFLMDDNGTATLSDDTIVDRAIIDGTPFGVNINLTLTRLAAENWSASGSASVTDTTLVNRIEGGFTSTAIAFGPTSTDLYIHGVLRPVAPDTSLLTASPWVFVGTSGSAGQDGVPHQVTVNYAEIYDSGIVTVLHYNVGTNSLDTLFSTPDTYGQGDISMTITPAPAALLLGFLGLGAAGLKLRRFA